MQKRSQDFSKWWGGGSPCVKQRVLTKFTMSTSTPPEYFRLFALKKKGLQRRGVITALQDPLSYALENGHVLNVGRVVCRLASRAQWSWYGRLTFGSNFGVSVFMEGEQNPRNKETTSYKINPLDMANLRIKPGYVDY